jgi:hypothetical protein
MITGRATADPNFVRLDRRRNPLHGYDPIPSSVYKRGALASLRNQRSSMKSNTEQTRSMFHCLQIEGYRPQLTDSFKHAILDCASDGREV